MKTAKTTKKPAIIAKPAAKPAEAAPERKRTVKSVSARTISVKASPVLTSSPAPTSTSAVSRTPATQPTREITTEMIAERAYLLWEKQGRPHGAELTNWLLAESQLKEEIQSFSA